MVEYDGTDYHGFAIQTGLRSVQGELESAVAMVTGVKTRVVGSGRTDAGAHALAQVVSFHTESRLAPLELMRALNANLPPDLVVKQVEEAEEGFHARRSARRRHYRYSLWNADLPSVFTRRYRLHVSGSLDLEAMNQAAGTLVGTRDFSCFTYGVARFLAGGRRRTTVRTLFSARWQGTPPGVDFDVVGTAFLPHMIRNMVGAMLRVGQGRLAPQEFCDLVDRSDPQLSTVKAPAHGLMLVGVEY